MGRSDDDALSLIALGLAGAGVLAAVAVAVRTYVSQRIALEIEAELRRRLLERMLTAPLDELQGASTGDLVSRATVDLRQLRVIVGATMPAAIQGFAAIGTVGVVMVASNPLLALAALAPLPLIVLLGARYAGTMRTVDYATRSALGDVAAQAQEDVAGIDLIKGFGLESDRRARFRRSAERVRDSALRSARVQARFGSVLAVLPGLGMLAVLAAGGLMAADGELSDAEFTTFFMYVVLLVNPAQQVGWILGTAQTAAAAAARVLEVADAPAAQTPPPPPPPPADSASAGPPAGLRLAGATVSRGSARVLHGVDLDVPAGAMKAVTGPPGAGKSTLLELADGLRRADAGRVEVEGVEIARVPEPALRRTVALLTDPPFALSGTVRENITLGKPSASEEEVRRAARIAAADGFIHALPDGYDTLLGEGGTWLSGGQRQRLALARALLVDPILLLLDNPTGSLDRLTEGRIIEALDRGRAGRATLAASPRLAVLAAADETALLAAGAITASGTAGALAELATPAQPAGNLTSAAAEEPEPRTKAGDHAPRRGEAVPTGHPHLLHTRVGLIRELLVGQWRTVAMGAVATLLALALTLVPPYLGGIAVDDVARPDDGGPLLAICVALAAVLAIGAAATAVEIVQLTAGGQTLLARLRIRAMDHLLALPMRYFDRAGVGSLVSRITNDVEALDQLLIAGLSVLISSLLTMVVTTVLLLVLDVELALIVCAVLPLALLATALFSRRLSWAYHGAADALAAMTGFLTETVSGMATLRAFGAGAARRERFDELNRKVGERLLSTVALQAAYVALIELLAGTALAVVVLFGGELAIDGAITVGLLVSFATYLRAAIAPIPSLVGLYDIYSQGTAGLDHVLTLLAEPAEERAREDGSGDQDSLAKPLEPSFSAEGVWFAYDGRDWVLEDVTAEIPAGSDVALVGLTGAGKSTLVKLLLGLYEPDRGTIRIGGRDLRSVPLGALRGRVGYVAQDPFLFAGTVWENIALAAAEPSREGAREAAERVGALAALEALPGGLDTVVASGGAALSAGQRQLVALARATLGDHQILVLDEPTSSIDALTDATIREALSRLHEGRTTITIAHRLSTVRSADRILVVDGGRIVAAGSHEELLAAGGLYAQLCSAV